jgi:very-short-patch-repair endonuclease
MKSKTVVKQKRVGSTLTRNDAILRFVCDELGREAGVIAYYEYRFHPVRRWRLDAAFPEKKIGVEIDGGAFIQGRHTRGVGFRKDCEKINAAGLLGWRVFRFLPEQIEDEMIVVLSEALGINTLEEVVR